MFTHRVRVAVRTATLAHRHLSPYRYALVNMCNDDDDDDDYKRKRSILPDREEGSQKFFHSHALFLSLLLIVRVGRRSDMGILCQT